MDRWEIVLVLADVDLGWITKMVGHIYMNWENLPFAPFRHALRLIGHYTIYLVYDRG